MKIEITTYDGRKTSFEVRADTPRQAISEAVKSPLAPEDIENIKTLRRADVE